MWPCNDCGAPCPDDQELCTRCRENETAAERNEDEHPELRCPPRE